MSKQSVDKKFLKKEGDRFRAQGDLLYAVNSYEKAEEWKLVGDTNIQMTREVPVAKELHYKTAAEAYERAGDMRRAEKIWKKLAKSFQRQRRVMDAINAYENSGEHEIAEKLKEREDARESKRIGDRFRAQGDFNRAAACYEADGEFELAGDIETQVAKSESRGAVYHWKEALNLYEKAGNSEKAEKARIQYNRIANKLFKKGEKERQKWKREEKRFEEREKAFYEWIEERKKKIKVWERQKGRVKKELGGLVHGIAKAFGLTILLIGMYYLFSNRSITGNIIIVSLSNINISNGFLINFILVGILGLVCYNYLKE